MLVCRVGRIICEHYATGHSPNSKRLSLISPKDQPTLLRIGKETKRLFKAT